MSSCIRCVTAARGETFSSMHCGLWLCRCVNRSNTIVLITVAVIKRLWLWFTVTGQLSVLVWRPQAAFNLSSQKTHRNHCYVHIHDHSVRLTIVLFQYLPEVCSNIRYICYSALISHAYLWTDRGTLLKWSHINMIVLSFTFIPPFLPVLERGNEMQIIFLSFFLEIIFSIFNHIADYW